jgi:ABC-type lipoprotein export system ATPase subunit
MSMLELRNVSRARGTGEHAVEALREVDLVVGRGEVVLVEGPSGSGKTTLLSVAAGLLSAERGEVVLAGEPIAKLSSAGRRAHRARVLGFVFQKPNLLDALTVRENVSLVGMLAGLDRSESIARAEALLEELGVAHLTDRRPSALSGGEQQRVAVARALVHGPQLLLADEPTANLDSTSGRRVGEALAHMARAKGIGVLVATHDARLRRVGTRRVGTRRLWMEDGRLCAPTDAPAQVDNM